MSGKPTVYLIASQMPQQELGLIAQLLQSQGYVQDTKNTAHQGVLTFKTKDGANQTVIRFYQEVGALRLELSGEVSMQIGKALSQYMPPLTAEQLGGYCNETNSDMERRLYTVLIVLTYPDAASAMKAMRTPYFDDASNAVREGLVQGLAFLESPDVGPELEKLEKDYQGQDIAKLIRKAIDGLAKRGLVRESAESFKNKITALADEQPKEALELIEAYIKDAPCPEIRAIHAHILRTLGRLNDAAELLSDIRPDSPDCVDAWCERALLLEASGSVQAAMNDVEKALNVEPDNTKASEIIRRLGLVLNQAAASSEERLEQFTKAIDDCPDDVNLRCQRAECLTALSRPDEALTDLLAAKQISPNDPRLPLLLAAAYLSKGFLGSALEQASIARKNHVPSAENAAWIIKPRVFMTIGDAQRALDAIHEIPTDIRMHSRGIILCQAIALEQMGRTEEAGELYAKLNDIAEILKTLDIPIYTHLPQLESFAGKLSLAEKPSSPLDREPIDPFFKRCAACGALAMKRRTYCRECNSPDFFS